MIIWERIRKIRTSHVLVNNFNPHLPFFGNRVYSFQNFYSVLKPSLCPPLPTCPGTLWCHLDPDTLASPPCLCSLRDSICVVFTGLKDLGRSRVYQHTRSKVVTLPPCSFSPGPWETLGGRAGETAIHGFAPATWGWMLPKTASKDSSQILRS